MITLLPQAIETHARHAPDSTAITFLDQQLTYAQLDQGSNRLANCLLSQGVTRGDRVGIYMDKSLDLAIAIYGILKSGAAYVPLDPLAPTERIAEIVEDCSIKVLLSGDSKRARLKKLAPFLRCPLLLLGVTAVEDLCYHTKSWQEIMGSYANDCPATTIEEKDLAYIIYTSGSTGKPKGIMHTHHSGLSFARWAVGEYGLQADDRLSNHAPLHFDLAIFDFFAAAVAGASTVIIPEEYTKMPASYSQLLADSQVSVLFTVPFSLIQLLLRGVLDSRDMSKLRWVIFGGEPFPIKYLYRIMQKLPAAKFDNMYGPAEVNGCSHYTVASLSAEDTAIPIGKICNIAQALVVDADMALVPDGEGGELLVCTPTMMQGYWARADLNEQAFFTCSSAGAQEQIYYRTGDLVRREPDGNLWFLGRLDRQVKVRGYRVELDEIEATLVAHEAVEEAAVYAVSADEGVTCIHSSITFRTGAEIAQEGLFAYLKQRLPPYALPSRLTIRPSFPRTSTGKIDRLVLSEEAVA